MFAITVAGEGDDAVQRVASVLRGRRFRVETLRERRSSSHRAPSDGLVVVSMTSDRLQMTRVVLEARRDEDVRFLPFALVSRSIERGAANAIGARTLVRYDGPPEELVTEIRRMLLREQESAVLVHQLEGELGALSVTDVLETLARGRRDAVVRIVCGSSRGAIRVRAGVPVTATFDADVGRRALESMKALSHGRFRVELRSVDDTDELGALDAESARAILSVVDRDRPPPSRPVTTEERDERAPYAALAAALVNAVTAYARRWVSESVCARELEAARKDCLASHPALASFRVSPAGIVLVQDVNGAAAARGAGIGDWIVRSLERLDAHRPGRFGRSHVSEVVGGLSRLLEQVGWSADFEAATGG
jgi:hypothetical protein